MVSRFSRADFQVAVNSCNFRRHGMPKTTWLTCPSSRAPRLHEFLQDMEQCVSLKFGQVLVYQNPLVTRFSASRTVPKARANVFAVCCHASNLHFLSLGWHDGIRFCLPFWLNWGHLKSTPWRRNAWSYHQRFNHECQFSLEGPMHRNSALDFEITYFKSGLHFSSTTMWYLLTLLNSWIWTGEQQHKQSFECCFC